jgi:hypothetical protein
MENVFDDDLNDLNHLNHSTFPFQPILLPGIIANKLRALLASIYTHT